MVRRNRSRFRLTFAVLWGVLGAGVAWGAPGGSASSPGALRLAFTSSAGYITAPPSYSCAVALPSKRISKHSV